MPKSGVKEFEYTKVHESEVKAVHQMIDLAVEKGMDRLNHIAKLIAEDSLFTERQKCRMRPYWSLARTEIQSGDLDSRWI